MGTVRVTTPVPDYSGSVGGVVFVKGEALVDEDAQEMTYLRTAGYIIGEPDVDGSDESDVDDDSGEEPEPMPARNASTDAWRTWAVEFGGMSAEEAGDLSRDALVERFAPSDEEINS